MELLDQYQALRDQIFSYFGYVEDWQVFPLDDSRHYFWKLDGEGPGTVKFAETEHDLFDESGTCCYENEILALLHLSKSVYRGADYTLVVVDTHTDGNKYLQIFSNAKERK